jgi:hypothetical protein
MVNQIFAKTRTFALIVDDQIFLCDNGNLIDTACQAYQPGVKIPDILFQLFRAITLRIDRNKDRLDFLRKRRVFLFGQRQAVHQIRKIYRADIGAIGKAKIDDPVFSGKIRIGTCSAILIG